MAFFLGAADIGRVAVHLLLAQGAKLTVDAGRSASRSASSRLRKYWRWGSFM
jgi:NAD(P)-dependent dehydrogenase (short-subunit alcohol dehydrogenase family)